MPGPAERAFVDHPASAEAKVSLPLAMRFDLTTLNLVLASDELRSIIHGAEREHLALAAASKPPASAWATWNHGSAWRCSTAAPVAWSPPRPAGRWCATSAA